MSKLLALQHDGGLRPSDGFRTVDFPSLEHFMEDVLDAGVAQVRVDVFAFSQPSELSFLYYMSFVLFVTALDAAHQSVYEYKEVYGTKPSASPEVMDEVAVRRVNKRREEVMEILHKAGFRTAHGRFVPDEE